ncbi:MAG: MBL fold metallo-hydrolase [Proteobacteria bacterium]|nr:MBL fold metallo-hydrolase [Pseudomonadota bacterium]
MKVTVIGASSAFSVGEFKNAIPVDKLQALIPELTKKFGKSGGTEDKIAKYVNDYCEEHKEHLYAPAWQSNFLIEFDQTNIRGDDSPYRLVLDFGSDVRHALASEGLDFKDIDAYYVSHPHDDHIGGIEGIALKTFFNPFFTKKKVAWLDGENIIDKITYKAARGQLYKVPKEAKPVMFGHRDILDALWQAAEPGLLTLQQVREVTLETYFHTKEMMENEPLTFKDGKRTWQAYIVLSMHVVSGDATMPSYGLIFETEDTIVFFPTDTQFMVPPQLRGHYMKSDYIFHDTETSPFPSGVHTRLEELKTLPADLKKKMILYHYDSNVVPEVDDGEFYDIAYAGSAYEF